MKAALFPGSFDPLTMGHYEIVDRGRTLFDRIILAIGVNSRKQTLFSVEERLGFLETVYGSIPDVEVATYEGLTTVFAESLGVNFLLRGLRNGNDLEYERPIAFLNKHMSPDLETVFLISSGQTTHISSTIVRELIKYGGDINGLVPPQIVPDIYAKFPPGGA